MIPEGRGWLAVRVGGRAWVEFGAVLAVRCEPGFGISIVVGQNAGAVKMSHVADSRKGRFRTMDGMIDGQEMRSRQFADPIDIQGLSALRFDGGARP